ncbi:MULTISPECIES: ROK family transcriptional regulator [Paenibacillus]|uniref:ROK family protein n=1 Tax=Paenibacillus radicis (ex Xue et al. 2023) TaxID=2972489 RepID=A0ABT1YLK9_9BACL|nr:ROK family protein [Paenibacillus radicis (ex Xue et al. 2023)]MCR8634072.1 ROK family protein [Paenibacillus radicis (ex Xue et al. 2023)]
MIIPSKSDQKGSKTSIIQALRMHGSMPRIQLTKITELSRATISSTISELIEWNLVKETEKAPSTGGRPAISLELVPGSHAIMGADLDNQAWTLGVFDLLGNVLHKTKIPVSSSRPEEAVQELVDHTSKFVQEFDKEVIQMFGLGVPGLVDTRLGIIKSASDLGWSNVDIEEMVSKGLGWPTVAINRHRARGLAECRFGSGKDYKHMIYVGVGSGIAAGIFNDRQLVSGSFGGAGELGHITVEPDGPVCPCGNNGCLHLYSTASAMEQEARRLLRAGQEESSLRRPGHDLQLLRAKDVCLAADQGDELAIRVVNHAATYLGIALANLVNLLNPEAIILGGAIPGICSTYVQTATKVMQQRSMMALSAGITVNTASLAEIGGALGAINFALDRHFSFNMVQ